LLLVAAAVAGGLHWRPDRGPVYQGRRTADWVEQAFQDPPSSAAFAAVVKIGAPAVPFIARRLHDRSHKLRFLSSSNIMPFGPRHPRINDLVAVHLENCTDKHLRASWLLWLMGTNAQAAIPDVIDCLKHCHSMHIMSHVDLLDTLGEISGANPAAIPYLTKLARGDDSLNLRAAATAYQINGQTNLFVETCQRLSRQNPTGFLQDHELFWFEDDPKLNQHLVPLLEKLYLDPQLDSNDKAMALDDLESRTNDAAAMLFCARFHQK